MEKLYFFGNFEKFDFNQVFENFDFGQNFQKKTLLFFIFEKSPFFAKIFNLVKFSKISIADKFSKTYDFGPCFRKTWVFFWKILENFDLSKIFEKNGFWSKLSKNLILIKILKTFDFVENLENVRYTRIFK